MIGIYSGRGMTLGDLRAFLREHRGAPNDIPVTLLFPVDFEDGFPVQCHETCSLRLCPGMGLWGTRNDSNESSEAYIPVRQRRGGDWDFEVVVWAHDKDVYGAQTRVTED